MKITLLIQMMSLPPYSIAAVCTISLVSHSPPIVPFQSIEGACAIRSYDGHNSYPQCVPGIFAISCHGHRVTGLTV